MIRTALISTSLMLTTVAGLADSSDDTLKFYLGESDLVVLGEFTDIGPAIISEKGVPYYACQFKIADVVKGVDELKAKTIPVTVGQFELEEADRHPLLKKKGECILFLRNIGTPKSPTWESADFWFAIQHPRPMMANALKRLSAEMREDRGKTNRVGVGATCSDKDAKPIARLCSQTDAAKTGAPKGFKFTPAQAIEKAQPYFPSNPFVLAVYADSRFYYVERTGTTLFAPKDHLDRVREHGIKIDGDSGEVVRGVKRPPAK